MSVTTNILVELDQAFHKQNILNYQHSITHVDDMTIDQPREHTLAVTITFLERKKHTSCMLHNTLYDILINDLILLILDYIPFTKERSIEYMMSAYHNNGVLLNVCMGSNFSIHDKYDKLITTEQPHLIIITSQRSFIFERNNDVLYHRLAIDALLNKTVVSHQHPKLKITHSMYWFDSTLYYMECTEKEDIDVITTKQYKISDIVEYEITARILQLLC